MQLLFLLTWKRNRRWANGTFENGQPQTAWEAKLPVSDFWKFSDTTKLPEKDPCFTQHSPHMFHYLLHGRDELSYCNEVLIESTTLLPWLYHTQPGSKIMCKKMEITFLHNLHFSQHYVPMTVQISI
jgi:hypothetical protein